MNRKLKYSVAALLVLVSSASAYELSTHALITFEAVNRSTLSADAPNSIWTVLGFDRLDQNAPWADDYMIQAFLPGSSAYFDEAPVVYPTLPDVDSDFVRLPQEQERRPMRVLIDRGFITSASEIGGFELQAAAWLVRGAVREDDNDVRFPLFNIWLTDDERDDDPHGPLFRAAKHFYDPINDRALDFVGPCVSKDYGCLRFTSWSMGSVDPLVASDDVENEARRNHFSWQDARNNYWQALTLSRDVDSLTYAESRRLSSKERKWRWATAVKTVGHVLHFVQDAAQPQHVRNDAHSPPRITSIVDPGLGPAAGGAFEAFTEYRVTLDYEEATELGGVPGNSLRYLDESIPQPGLVPRPVFGNYPTPQFATPVKFLTTRHVESGESNTDILARRGMADYSNRGFFTAGTLPGDRECIPPGAYPCFNFETDPTYPLPDETIPLADFEAVLVSSELKFFSAFWGSVAGEVRIEELTAEVTDSVFPDYMDTLPAVYNGRVPLLTRSSTQRFDGLVTRGAFDFLDYQLSLNNFRYQADVLLPRAVAYSAGMIDYFFRGRLEVQPPTTGVFAALNQGDGHMVDADGYPRRTGNNEIFGFEQVRLRVRNATEAIVESGTGEEFPQYIGAPVGSNLIGDLVAVARYHRDRCYQPDLSEERIQGYASPGPGPITEPACIDRTDYQEISVSAPVPLTATDLDSPSELDNLASGEGIEYLFDFSSDPIPVNASDLFIQVVYRGRMGVNLDTEGRPGNFERDAIAVGTYDAREPTFLTFWNNTDYYHSSSGTWIPWNLAFPLRTTTSFWVCAGAPSRLVWSYLGSLKPGVAMGIPPEPGFVRIGVITGVRELPTQRWAFRGSPQSADSPQPLPQSVFSRGAVKQANLEVLPEGVLANPYSNCDATTPVAEEFWCQDPVQRRRGAIVGHHVQPIFQAPAGQFNPPPDVDSVPLPPFSIANHRSAGTLRYNTDVVLTSCPTPSSVSASTLATIQSREAEATGSN